VSNHSVSVYDWEDETEYRISGEDAVTALNNSAEVIGDLVSTITNGSQVQASSNFLTDPIGTIFEAVNQVQSNENGEAIVEYSREHTLTTTQSSFDFDLSISPSGTRDLKVELGAEAAFEMSESFDSVAGKWISGRHYVLEEYPMPSFNYVQYKDLVEGICDRIPMEIKIAAFVINLLCPPAVCPFKSEDTNYYFYITDSSGIDTTGHLRYKYNTIPPGIDTVECFTWGWWGSSALSREEDLSERSSYILKKIKTVVEETRGMQYGYGGFYQFEPVNSMLADSAFLTMRYLQSEVEEFGETELAMYRENKTLATWEFVGGLVDTVNNTVTALIDRLGTFTLAPRLPSGSILLQVFPDSIPADGISELNVVSETIHNNDGTVVSDNAEFTLISDGGIFLTSDQDTLRAGLQIYPSSGILSFQLKSSEYAQIVTLTASSSAGSAYGETIVKFYDTGNPTSPTLLSAKRVNNTLDVVWNANPEIDIKGYKIYYDLDASGEPYNGTANIYGKPSPVDAGNDTTFALLGLMMDTSYYLVLTTYDASGNESPFSNELKASTKSYLCGDANGNDAITIIDVTYMLAYLYKGGPAPDPMASANVNGIGQVNILDVTYLIAYLYKGGPGPSCL
jgi:hypothetical protein